MPVTAEMYHDGTYLAKNPTWGVEDSPSKAKFIIEIIKRNHLALDNICEIGYGAGQILRQLSLRMPQVRFTGYEVSRQAFELCKKRESGRITFHCRDLTCENVYFDCLMCIDVLEHVPNYIRFIEALKPKADYKIFHIQLDISVVSVLRGHMMNERRNFTKDTALATLTDSGYEIIDQCYTTWFDAMPHATLEDKLALFLRKRLYAISSDFMAKWMRGCSLLVLAK